MAGYAATWFYGDSGVLTTTATEATSGVDYHYASNATWIGDSTATTTITAWIGNTIPYVPPPYQQLPEVSREQQAAIDALFEAQRQASYRHYEQQHAAQVSAGARAKKLLLMMLTKTQRAEFTEQGHFFVTGQSGRRYRVQRGRHGNIYELDASGKEVATLCAAPLDVPDEDAMLAQKLQIEHDEAAFLRVANRRELAA